MKVEFEVEVQVAYKDGDHTESGDWTVDPQKAMKDVEKYFQRLIVNISPTAGRIVIRKRHLGGILDASDREDR